jgi:hypothetical protein
VSASSNVASILRTNYSKNPTINSTKSISRSFKEGKDTKVVLKISTQMLGGMLHSSRTRVMVQSNDWAAEVVPQLMVFIPVDRIFGLVAVVALQVSIYVSS